ncbi:MAG: ABC transporter ATP-binding protein [Pseudomonadota bacterium]
MLETYRMLLEMMAPSERRRFWLLVAVLFVLSSIEAASVLSILPFLQLLSEPDLVETQPALNWAYTRLGFTDITQFQIAVGVAVFLVTVFGLIMKALTVWMTMRFALMRSYSLSARLMTGYLHQTYEWFLTRNTSQLGASVLKEVEMLVRQTLLPAVRIIPEVFSVALLVIALCIIEPTIAIGGAVLLGGVYSVIYFSVRRIVRRLGVRQLENTRSRFHIVQESTGGLKELKIMGLEGGFLQRFRNASYRLARAQTSFQVISALPRYALEAVAFGGMILLVLYLLVRTGGSVQDLIPTLGVIAAIGMRLIPALQQVYNRLATIKNGRPVLEKIHEDMTKLDTSELQMRDERDAVPAQPLTKALELRDVHYSYPGTERGALDGLNMTISANTTVGVVGGTGAGKTTLIDIMLGLLLPGSGEMRVDGTVITPDTRRSWQKTLGYVPQTIFLADSTVAENIAFGVPKDDIDMARVEAAARTAALHDFVTNELSHGYQTEVGERGTRLSGGQRQRVGIARALYQNPSTLILDEATSALDNLTESAVMDAVAAIAGQKTIVMIAHRLSTVRDCDVIFLLRHGAVAAHGTFDELIAKDAEFREMAGALANEASAG